VKTDAERINLIFQKTLARNARPKETASLMSFLKEQREHYQTDTEEATKVIKIGNAPQPKTNQQSELAAWTQVCRVALNLHETITKY
jgi:hypothetical protein